MPAVPALRGHGSRGPGGPSTSSSPCRSQPLRTPRGTARGARRGPSGRPLTYRARPRRVSASPPMAVRLSSPTVSAPATASRRSMRRSTGADFSMNAAAPSWRAFSMSPCSSKPLYRTTRVPGEAARTWGSASRPSSPGIDTSSSIRQGWCSVASEMASVPSAPSPTTRSAPDIRRRILISRRTSDASSTITMVAASAGTGRRYLKPAPPVATRAEGGDPVHPGSVSVLTPPAHGCPQVTTRVAVQGKDTSMKKAFSSAHVVLALALSGSVGVGAALAAHAATSGRDQTPAGTAVRQLDPDRGRGDRDGHHDSVAEHQARPDGGPDRGHTHRGAHRRRPGHRVRRGVDPDGHHLRAARRES